MGLLNQTPEVEPTKSRENPKQKITQRSGLTQKEGIKPIKGHKKRRIQKIFMKSENKHQTSPLTDQITRRNREVAQLQWREKSEMTTPPCKTQKERWK